MRNRLNIVGRALILFMLHAGPASADNTVAEVSHLQLYTEEAEPP